MWFQFKRSGVSALLMLALGIILGLGLANPVNVVSSQNVDDAQTQLLRGLYTQANPSVVSIDVRIPAGSRPDVQSGPGGAQSPFAFAAGSGFVYDTSGHIVTNAHVVQGTDRVEVTFSDDASFHATIVGIDLDSDLAVIHVDGDTSKYKPLALADSDAVAVGDRAIAIGNPFERAGTMTHGIVSGVRRSVVGTAQTNTGGVYTIPDAIQTDAALNPGNSGGPLLNSLGQVIGVNEQIASEVQQSSGVSFAIPSNLVKQVADALIKDGKIQHSFLGIGGNSLSLDVNEALKLPPNTLGAYVSSVEPGSPAANAGLRAGTNTTDVNGVELPIGGDVIVAVDKQPVHHFDDLTSYLFLKTHPGQKITLTVLRGGKQQDIQVTLGARPQASSQS